MYIGQNTMSREIFWSSWKQAMSQVRSMISHSMSLILTMTTIWSRTNAMKSSDCLIMTKMIWASIGKNIELTSKKAERDLYMKFPTM